MRPFSTTSRASSRCMFRSSTLPPRRAALTMTLTTGLSMAGEAWGRERGNRKVYHWPMDRPEQRIRIVLVGTQHPGNIGSAARAMKTMGLSRLVLVAPERFPHPEAQALAAGADDLLAAAAVHATLAEAVADCTLVLGC